LTAVATAVLGISAGAMLAEQMVLVPYWRSLPPADFLRWFAENEPRLVAFYGPLEIAAMTLAVLATLLHALRRRAGIGWLACSMLLAVAVLALYPAYFREVNARFAAGTIDVAQVPAELVRWSAWQWYRIAAGMGAFLTSVAALSGERA
jgi:hypothetical protein